MKKKLVGILLGTVAVLTLVACGSKDKEVEVVEFNLGGGATESGVTGDGEVYTSPFGNPWVDSNKADVLKATGFDMPSPEGAANVAYSYMPETGMAQLDYVLDNVKWIYRKEKTSALEDISGMYYDWDYTGDVTVSGYAGKEYSSVLGEGDDMSCVRVVNWYDAHEGVSCSLVALGNDLNGMDTVVYAENIFTIGAAESDGIAPVDEELLKNYKEKDEYKAFLGTHISTYDGSDITVTEKDNGKLKVDVGIFRLCTLDDGEGTYENGVVNFSATDPSGEKIRCMLYFNENNSLCLIVEDSTWEYLPNGTIFEGFDD